MRHSSVSTSRCGSRADGEFPLSVHAALEPHVRQGFLHAGGASLRLQRGDRCLVRGVPLAEVPQGKQRVLSTGLKVISPGSNAQTRWGPREEEITPGGEKESSGRPAGDGPKTSPERECRWSRQEKQQ